MSRTSKKLMISSKMSTVSICKVVTGLRRDANAFREPMYCGLLAFGGDRMVWVGLSMNGMPFHATLCDGKRERASNTVDGDA